MFDRFEKHLDSPAFAVEADDFLVGQVEVGGGQGQPTLFFSVPDKNDLQVKIVAPFHRYRGFDHGFAGPFLYPPVQFTQPDAGVLMQKEHLGQVLEHADNRQLLAQRIDNLGEGEPAVHEEVVCLNASGQRPFDHRHQQVCHLCHGLATAAVAGSPVIDHLVDSLNPGLAVGRGEHGKIHRQKGAAIVPPKSKHPKAVDESVLGMIVEPGQELDPARVLAVVGGVVNNQNLAAFFAGEQADRSAQHGGQQKQKATPVGPGVAQQFISGVLAEPQPFVKHDTPVEIDPEEGQHENSPNDSRGRSPAHLANTTSVQQGADGAVIKEQINSRQKPRRFLAKSRLV